MLENESFYEKSGSFIDLMGSPIVFMHDINTLPNFSKIISQVDGIDKYERALSVARSEDVVITKYPPDRAFIQWLERVGLGSKKIIVLNGKPLETLPERILNYQVKDEIRSLLGSGKRSAIISPYYGGSLEQQASSHLELEMYANSETVKKFDSKINFKNLCRKIGVPVIIDKIFTVTSKIKGTQYLSNIVKESISETGKVIVKGEYGASASTTYVFDKIDLSLLKEIIANSQMGDRYLVEPFYHSLSQPSSVWFISKNKRIVHLKTSNQILDEETSHIGNEFPVDFDEDKVRKLSSKIAKYLNMEGFIGPFGIDYVETRDGIFAAECNPRVTGAMYPWELIYRLESNGSIKAARAENIHLPRRGLCFKDLMKSWGDVLYDTCEDTGVIVPFNVGPIKEGKVTVLGTGSSKNDVQSLFEFIKSNLPS
ncbi:MAG: ATP-grasp domain-containing protein [Candidatus Thorarchaeota archaeon]